MAGKRAPQAFAVTPPPGYASAIMALMLALPAIAVIVIFATERVTNRESLIGITITLGVIAIAGLACTIGIKRRRVELQDGMLKVVAGLFTHRVGIGGIDLERARIVDLAERTELRPVLKTGGMSLPGYSAGNFRLRKGLGKAFCLLTDKRRVLWLPERDGKSQLLLSLEHPQTLLDALRRA